MTVAVVYDRRIGSASAVTDRRYRRKLSRRFDLFALDPAQLEKTHERFFN
jgi:hypothetical protein